MPAMILVGPDFIKRARVCYSDRSMFDMRYHIASLVAVFLALTVGLLLGSLIVDNGLLANQQERLLDSIRADVSKINETNRLLQTEATELRDFQKQVLPIAINGRLVETSVTIVTLTTGQDELVNEVEKSLSQAGAASSRLNIDMNKIDISDTNVGNLLRILIGDDELDGGELERRFWPRVAAEITGAEPAELLTELINQNQIVGEGLGEPIKNAVVLAATDRRLGSRDILFLDSLSEISGVRVIAVETSDAKPSRIAAYKLRNVSTIDNIDSVPGKISLVYLLRERDVTAHFGTKSAADKPMP